MRPHSSQLTSQLTMQLTAPHASHVTVPCVSLSSANWPPVRRAARVQTATYLPQLARPRKAGKSQCAQRPPLSSSGSGPQSNSNCNSFSHPTVLPLQLKFQFASHPTFLLPTAVSPRAFRCPVDIKNKKREKKKDNVLRLSAPVLARSRRRSSSRWRAAPCEDAVDGCLRLLHLLSGSLCVPPHRH